jgi:glycerol-3-phosphate dehydrogenase
LPGGDFPIDGIEALQAEIAGRYPFLAGADVERIARAYGRRAFAWLAGAMGWGDLGQCFGAGLTAAEVNYLRQAEWAVTAEDVLWRRSKLGLRLDAAQVGALESYLAS